MDKTIKAIEKLERQSIAFKDLTYKAVLRGDLESATRYAKKAKTCENGFLRLIRISMQNNNEGR